MPATGVGKRDGRAGPAGEKARDHDSNTCR